MLNKNKIGFAVIFAAAVNFALFFTKLYTGIATQSVSIYSDAVNNLFDTLSCGLAFSGMFWMKKKAPPEYPDGYSKAENIIGFVMAVSVALTGIYFAYSSLERFIYPRPVNYFLRYAVVLCFAAAAKLIMGFAIRVKYKKTPSIILKTLYTDSFADCAVTLMILLSFLLTDYAGLRVDAVFGLAVSAVVITNSVKMIKSSVCELMDKNDEQLAQSIRTELEKKGFECNYIKAKNGFAAVELSRKADGGIIREIENELGIKIYFRVGETK